MTTSGTDAFNPAAERIIARALRMGGIIDDTETPTQSMYDTGLFALNSMTKEWEASGIHVWTESEAILFLQPGQKRYLIGPGTTDHACDANAYAFTALSSGLAAGATVIPVDDTTGFSEGGWVGVLLDTGAIWWSRQVGNASGEIVFVGSGDIIFDGSGPIEFIGTGSTAPGSITIADALPSAAASGNYVFGYQTDLPRPLKVPKARLHYFQAERDVPMLIYSRQEYMDLPNKTNPGTQTAAFYSPQMRQGEMFCWPNVQGLGGVGDCVAMRFTWYRQLQDWLVQTDTADLPQEWNNALCWNLARELGVEYSIPPQRWAIILAEADKKLAMVTDWDRDPEDVQFGFGWDGIQAGYR